MLLEEQAKTHLHSLILNIKEILNQINGYHLLEKAFVLTLEDLTSRQVIMLTYLAAGIKDMHLDKSGAVSVFTAFQYVVK
jgi:hypothetical protein